MMRAGLHITLVFALSGLRLVCAQTPPEAGAEAPERCWYVRGGCAARTGAAETPGVGGALLPAWQAALSGVIESEPLVWGDLVVVTTREKSGTRRLHVLNLRDGKKRVPPRTFKTEVPLQPSLWRDTVVVRAARSKLDALRIGRASVDSRWRHDAGTMAIHAPLFYDGELYVRVGPYLRRLDLRRKDPVWEVRGRFRGSLALRGRHIYALSYDGEGNAFLKCFRRDDGTEVGRVMVGHHEGEVPAEDAHALVTVLKERVAVRHALPISLPGEKKDLFTMLVHRTVDGAGNVKLSAPYVASVTQPVVAAGKHWLAQRDEKGEAQLVQVTGSGAENDRYIALAEGKQHAAYARSTVPMTRAGDVIYAGARAFSLATNTILWEGAQEPLFRLVPAADTVLVVDDERRLTALRAKNAWDSATNGFTRKLPGALDQAVAAHVDGSLLKGTLDYDPGSRTVQRKRVHWQLKDVLLLLDERGAPVHTLGPAAARLGLRAVCDDAMAREYAALSAQACTAADPELVAYLLERATEHGIDSRKTASTEKKLGTLRRRPKKVKPALVKKLKAKAETTARRPQELLWRCLQGLPAEAPLELRVDLLRDLLEMDPQHAGARKAVFALLPPEVENAAKGDATGWLDFVEATSQTRIGFIKRPAPDQKKLTPGERELGSALHTWRKDIVGIESKQLLVLAPVNAPGPLAGCLSMGELVCDTLEDIFRDSTARRDTRYPLKVQLFETKQEYMTESTKEMAGFGRHRAESLEWTAGHYDDRRGLSRIYLPARRDAFERVMNVFAHELTHHWLAERCPLFSTAEAQRRSPALPGYWVVEGFAEFVEEMRFDLRRRSVEKLDPRAQNLDIVANAKPHVQLLAWTLVFRASHLQFGRLKTARTLQVPMRWRLGHFRQQSPKAMFYAQAAAACHYLYHAEKGAHRKQLLEFVRRYYTGRTTKTTLQELFGLEPEELGRRILDWARAQVEG